MSADTHNPDAAEKAARAAGWYVNDNGQFETVMGCDVPDVVSNVSPSDPGAWATDDVRP